MRRYVSGPDLMFNHLYPGGLEINHVLRLVYCLPTVLLAQANGFKTAHGGSLKNLQPVPLPEPQTPDKRESGG
ncbi:hypothetical protein GCM10010924_04450 [Rhizobium wenxiniae]|nr:hypothetical protein GCM10010924_04450 [Rhizobium wenxiniae]